MTKAINFGLLTGAKPINDAIVFVASYLPAIGICAVPVFPPILYPSGFVHLYSPFSTVEYNIFLISSDVLIEIVFLIIFFEITFSLLSIKIFFTICGCNNSPPLINDENAVII